jgi:hypothetical protein
MPEIPGSKVPCHLNTRLLAMNPGQDYPGYVEVLDVVKLGLSNQHCIEYLEWIGDDAYPLILEHPSFNDGELRPAVVVRQEAGTVQFLLPDIGSIYRVSWLTQNGDRAENYGDISVVSPGPNQLQINNSSASLPNLNYLGHTFRMVLL